MYKRLLELILKYDNITVFRHQRPDGDAIFSQLALYYFLKENFKDKKIKLGGFNTYEVETKLEKVSDKFIKNSLAIVLDTAVTNRVDDIRFKDAQYVVKIDHHPPLENYGNLNIVKEFYASCSELLGEILLSKHFERYSMSHKVCRYLYCGIISDTQSFRTSSTSDKSLLIAAKVVKNGDVDISEANNYALNKTVVGFNRATVLRSHYIFEEKFGYAVITKKDLEKMGIPFEIAKAYIDELNTIKDINIWAIFIYNPKTGKFDSSVRSKRGYVLNKIAPKYNGGGHMNAVGMKDLSMDGIKKLIDIFKKMSKKS